MCLGFIPFLLHQRRRIAAGCRSRRWPLQDLARLSLLHRSSALDFLHQRRRVQPAASLKDCPAPNLTHLAVYSPPASTVSLCSLFSQTALSTFPCKNLKLSKMPKGSKTYVKPGWVAKQAKLTEYEKVRSKNIMEIDERCRALGVKHIANTVFGLGQTSRRKNGEGKRTLSEDDDNEEYRPPQGDFGLVSSDENTGDDGDDETSGYPANMVTHMIQEKRSRHACAVAAALAQATSAHPPVTRSSRAENTPEGAGQATPAQPRVTQSSHVDSMPEVATIARARSLTQIGSSSGHPDQDQP
ncbi:hypothetical protein MRB53_028674 [Persea americana]|uniref:Uncharacterized protein n=1 Tax=Persea americana TaxID=3435 RepID=A0ACC2KG53_PERAE|nr:hypothetical protein MRB53_028674 [Persea americana]